MTKATYTYGTHGESINNKTKRQAVTYGKSMYGGWYANYHDGEQWDGIHTETLRELKAKAEEMGLELKDRWDN